MLVPLYGKGSISYGDSPPRQYISALFSSSWCLIHTSQDASSVKMRVGNVENGTETSTVNLLRPMLEAFIC